ncbi:TA system antitoxin ParD family protein [Roseibium sp.]|uniref:TA system antitoxin ParD family protein n=1 Tax=Roseibium sp. TaxID=1936156 RepID=UPI003B513F64
MAQSVKLADSLMSFIRKESKLRSRSVAGQITHWVNIGRAIENSAAFDYDRITSVLESRLSPDDLASEEQDVWFAQFSDAMIEPSETERAFFEKRRHLGRGVGLSDAGTLIFEKDPGAK